MSKIFLDYGHGGSDPGAIGNGIREKDLTLQIGLKVAKILRGAKQTVVESRTTDKYLSLAQRTQLANKSKADVFVSIHINSFTKATANGVETFNHTGSANGAKLAKAIQDELVKAGLFRANRGVKTANFYVIKNTTMPAALTELGFISNKEDVKVMTTKQDQLAQAVANGILKYLGQATVKPTTPSKPKPSKPKLYTDDAKYPKLGNVGPNVLKIQKLLNRHGYKVAEDSSFGPATDKQTRKFQKDKGLVVDGQVGPATQRELNKSASSTKKLVVDGSWGPATTREWQRQAGTTVDGVISGQVPGPVSNAIPSASHNGRGGSDLVAAIHKALGMGSGRDIKQSTVRAIQRKLGTPVDGKISRPRSLMVVEIQKQLNAGTLMATLRK